MKNRFLILVVVAATLFACSGDSMISDDFNETAEKRKAVPFKIKNLEGTYTLGGGDPSCGPNFLIARGEGTISHLGKSMLLEDWCFDTTIPNDDGSKRKVIFVAANGDELYSNENGSVIWTGPLSFVEEFEFEGGTGRFANASGTFTEYVEISPPDAQGSGTFVLSSEGTITY